MPRFERGERHGCAVTALAPRRHGGSRARATTQVRHEEIFTESFAQVLVRSEMMLKRQLSATAFMPKYRPGDLRAPAADELRRSGRAKLCPLGGNGSNGQFDPAEATRSWLQQ